MRLNDFKEYRERDAQYYWDGEVTFRVLMELSPFVAMELKRMGRLRDEDKEVTLF